MTDQQVTVIEKALVEIEIDYFCYQGEVDTSKTTYRAMFSWETERKLTAGCPLGRGSSERSAIDDLVRRARMDDAGLTINDTEVVDVRDMRRWHDQESKPVRDGEW